MNYYILIEVPNEGTFFKVFIDNNKEEIHYYEIYKLSSAQYENMISLLYNGAQIIGQANDQLGAFKYFSNLDTKNKLYKNVSKNYYEVILPLKV